MAKKRGRPAAYETPEAMQEAVDNYIARCKSDGEPVTLTGGLIALGLNSKQTLSDYEQKDGFSGPVKRFRLAVEAEYERRLHDSSPTGAIFALKNMGWSDRQELEHTGANGGPIKTEAKIDPSGLSDSTLAELMAARKGEEG